MNAQLLLVGWLILLAVAGPLAIAALPLAPFARLLPVPLRVVGGAVAAALAFVTALPFLPARRLGPRG